MRQFKKPLVTIIMPACNAQKFIRAAIESILKQDFNQFELIIIDDCSEDDTYRIALEYRKNSKVRIYRNPKRMGDAKTRNRILRLARGQYIAPHDADDLMLQGRLRKQVEFLEAHPEFGVVFGKAIIVDAEAKKILRFIFPEGKDRQPLQRSGKIKNLPVAFNHGTALIRKKYILKAGGYEKSFPLGVDARLMRRLFRLTPFYFINKFCFVYRIHSQSICRRNLRENLEAMQKIFTAKRGGKPGDLDFYVDRQWVRVRSKYPRFKTALRWRLNFYSWLAKRIVKRGNPAALNSPLDKKSSESLSDPALFRLGFLKPFGAKLARQNEIFLEAALVSKNDRGILIIGEEGLRSEAVLSFLNQDFYYHSGNNPILYNKEGRISGRSFVDPLVLSRPLGAPGRRQDIWGQFWNPILQKYCLNMPFYRTYLIGDTCGISKIIYIQKGAENGKLRIKKLNFLKLEELLARDFYGKDYPCNKKDPNVLKILAKQAEGFFVKAPLKKLENLTGNFNTI